MTAEHVNTKHNQKYGRRRLSHYYGSNKVFKFEAVTRFCFFYHGQLIWRDKAKESEFHDFEHCLLAIFALCAPRISYLNESF